MSCIKKTMSANNSFMTFWVMNFYTQTDSPDRVSRVRDPGEEGDHWRGGSHPLLHEEHWLRSGAGWGRGLLPDVLASHCLPPDHWGVRVVRTELQRYQLQVTVFIVQKKCKSLFGSILGTLLGHQTYLSPEMAESNLRVKKCFSVSNVDLNYFWGKIFP